MITAQPLSDEFMLGHLGRWRTVNHFRSVAQCLDELGRQYADQQWGPKNPLTPQIMARHSGLEVDDYIRLHTMLPFTAFSVYDKRIVNEAWSMNVAKRHGAGTPREAAYCCPSCAKEDLDYWGYSYWRRSHQLPGVYWCQKHPSERLHAVDAPDAFGAQPHLWIGAAKTRIDDMPIALQEHAEVRRFGEFCQAMLDHGRPLTIKGVRRVLGARAIASDLRIHTTSGSGRRPSDLAGVVFPPAFLQAVFPTFAKKRPGAYFRPIDGAVRTGNRASTATGTALVASMLFSSVASTFKAFVAADQRAREEEDPPPRDTSLSPLYFSSRGDVQAIARALGLSVEEAQHLVLAKRGTILFVRNPRPEHKALTSFLQGETLLAACRRYGVTAQVVENLLRLRVMTPRTVSLMAMADR